MTNTPGNAATAIDTIRANLDSNAPTVETLRFLRNVLGLESQDDPKPTIRGSKKAVEAKKPLKSRAPIRSATKQPSRNAAAPFRIHSATDKELPCLSAGDRSRVATEAFNVTLKRLGAAAKAQRDVSKPADGNSTPPRLPHPKRALQETSPNREGKKIAGKKTQASQLQHEEPDWKVLAECSRSALQVLRDNTSGKPSSAHDMGMENAALILVDRCITLCLTSQVQLQLSDLHQRYSGHKTTKGSCSENTIAKFLLGRSDAADDSSTFGFTSSMQSQVLRFALLLGPKCIDEELLKSIQLETVGSPGWVILQGRLKGLLKPEQAGMQLRTISLALTKLYSLTTKESSGTISAERAFELFCIALRIKFESWTHLGHTPGPAAEVWRPLHAAAKRLLAHARKNQTSECSISQYLRSFRDFLSLAQCDHHIPTELTDTMLQVAQSRHEQSEILALIEDELQTCERVSYLALSCQIMVARLGDLSRNREAMLSSAERAKSAFEDSAVLPFADLDQVLLHVARLRKAAVEAITALETSLTNDTQKEEIRKLQSVLIQLTYACFEFLRRQIGSTDMNTTDSPRKEKQQALLTTLMKSIEAVLATEKCTIMRSSEMDSMACQTLKSCLDTVECLPVQFVTLLTDRSVQVAINHLQVRLSQSFWSRFLKAVEQRKEISDQVLLLDSSLKALSGLELADQKTAYMGLKYEKLAACHLEMNNYEMSQTALRKAIEFNIRDGVLHEVADGLLSGPYSDGWSRPGSNCRVLERNLITYSRTFVAHSSSLSDADTLFDDGSLSPIHRALLLERQIYAILERDVDNGQLKVCKSHARSVLMHLSHEEHRVYKMRFVCNVVNFGLKKKMSPLDFLLEPVDIQEALETDDPTNNTTFLGPYAPGLRSLLRLLYGFYTARVNDRMLEADATQISKMVRQCASLASLRAVFDDLETCISTLLITADFAEMFENQGALLLTLEALQHLMSVEGYAPKLSQINVNGRLGKLHGSLQAVRPAEKAFKQGENALRDYKSDVLAEINFALAYSEYHLNNGHLEQCSEWLQRARHSWEGRLKSDTSLSTKSRLREQSCLCRATFVASQLAYEQGHLPNAITLGRQSAKIASAIWLSIESFWNATTSPDPETQADAHMSELVVDFSKLDLSLGPKQSITPTMAAYWEEISLYCKAFGHLAFLNSHCGLYQDAVQFYEQALKVARKTGLAKLAAVTSSSLALLHARAGHTEKAKAETKALTDITVNPVNGLAQTLLDINLSDVHIILGDAESASRYLDEAMRHLPSQKIDREKPKARHVSKSKAPQVAVRPLARKPAVKDKKKVAPVTEQSPDAALISCSSTLELKRIHERLFASCSMLRLLDSSGGTHVAFEALGKSAGILKDPRASASEALQLVQSALKLFSEDAVHNVLAETAMALPVRYRSARKSGRVSFVHNMTSQPLMDDKAKRTRKATKAKQVERASPKGGNEVLLEAYEILCNANDSRQSQLSSDIAHTIHKTLTGISLLSTALGEPFVKSSSDLVLDAMSPLDLARGRERLITMAELATAEKSQIQSWPGIVNAQSSSSSFDGDVLPSYDLSLLPASWSVVFLGLSEDRSELFVARLAQQGSPFVVRIPLARPDLSDADHEELDFHSAKAEIQSIIAKANSSAHDPRGSSADKLVRKAWYAERQALDKQLGNLLENIENVWFGGFRGLLSASNIEATELLKFGRSLSSTLNKHLPSRQKSSKSAGPRVELHDHVLQLFVALGHPRDIELDDAIMDLLYFVIDVLQFNGERNAYDEIDFDAIMVEITDALHAYHDATTLRTERQDSHMILIADKELQVFPWESMSCLKDQAVSRMPSLGATWERLRQVRQTADQPSGYFIPRSEGAYILNPSSDLTSTQEAFGLLFQDNLPEFEAIVNRPPSEKEFEAILHDQSLVLYFGHGGGAQYIRGRTIRKMDKCAVTLLMGCSSAKLTECGVYEPYGMPWNYLNGGSPAVVGTLWDVTDRDIDRFALELMNDWGLTGRAPGSERKAEKAPRKERGSKEGQANSLNPDEQKRGPVSLDQAVAYAREACLLKYLNGAAPVMYGIPVFLE